MSTSLLYHGWGLRGYRHRRTRFEAGAVRFQMTCRHERLCCSSCGSREVTGAGRVHRSFRALPIGGQAVSIDLPVQRLACDTCGKTRQAELSLADPRRSYTHCFRRYVLDLSRHTTIKAVALRS